MPSEDKRQWAVEQLKAMAAKVERLPQKSDFDEVTRARIKSFLGPWPRALEAAGLKKIKSTKEMEEHEKVDGSRRCAADDAEHEYAG